MHEASGTGTQWSVHQCAGRQGGHEAEPETDRAGGVVTIVIAVQAPAQTSGLREASHVSHSLQTQGSVTTVSPTRVLSGSGGAGEGRAGWGIHLGKPGELRV